MPSDVELHETQDSEANSENDPNLAVSAEPQNGGIYVSSTSRSNKQRPATGRPNTAVLTRGEGRRTTRSIRQSLSGTVHPDACALAEITRCDFTSTDLQERVDHLNLNHKTLLRDFADLKENLASYILRYESKRKQDSIMCCPCGYFVANTPKGRGQHQDQDSCDRLDDHLSSLCQIAENNVRSIPECASDVSFQQLACSRKSNTWIIQGKSFKSKDWGSTVSYRLNSDRNVCFYANVLGTKDGGGNP